MIEQLIYNTKNMAYVYIRNLLQLKPPSFTVNVEIDTSKNQSYSKIQIVDYLPVMIIVQCDI